MSDKLTAELIIRHLEKLSHGGREAIDLFVEFGKHIHRHGAADGLHDWITIAAPALPEKERNEVLLMLMCSHLALDGEAEALMKLCGPATAVH
jgi:hypothetical protein